MNTSQSGIIAEIAVTQNLLQQNYCVFKEIGNNCKFDLVGIVNGKCIRIQVKSSEANEGFLNVLMVKTGPSGTRYTYNKNDFDILAVYAPVINQIAYLTWKDIGEIKCLTLRYQVNENKQKNAKNIRHFQKFSSFDGAVAQLV